MKNKNISTGKITKPKKKLLNKKKLLFLLLIFIILVIIYLLSLIPIKNILIINNNLISDQEIIRLANIENYPSFLKTTNASIIRRIKTNPIIKKVNVKKDLLGKITITITEKEPLFIKKDNNKTVFTDDLEMIIDKELNLPLLVSSPPDDIYKLFKQKFILIDKNIRNKISEIIYTPNDIDKNRFMFLMDDYNSVYITLNEIEKVNRYNQLIDLVGDKKGILDLDSIMYFKEYKN